MSQRTEPHDAQDQRRGYSDIQHRINHASPSTGKQHPSTGKQITVWSFEFSQTGNIPEVEPSRHAPSHAARKLAATALLERIWDFWKLRSKTESAVSASAAIARRPYLL